ncbi:hypothetical protein [Natrialba hulunbeirensis]|uniref:hypothetical protein n=1 Tax=Natrialba hulunbeirensis TaxID=123783 RepID=UPI001268F67C|nr:hypothetical protein [Natrialba hulunbeirensis]
MEISDRLNLDMSDDEIGDKIAFKAYNKPESISEDDMTICKTLLKSSNDDARKWAAAALRDTAAGQPGLVSPASELLWAIIIQEEERKMTKLIARNALEELYHNSEEDFMTVCHDLLVQSAKNKSHSKDAEELSLYSASLTVTEERLKGREAFFVESIPHLNFDEQPHFNMALSKGKITPDWSFAVKKQGSTQPIIEGDVTASLTVTDGGVRILSKEGQWAIPYGKITHVKVGSYPAIKIFVGNESYIVRLARTIHSKEEANDCGNFIMKICKLLSKNS